MAKKRLHFDHEAASKLFTEYMLLTANQIITLVAEDGTQGLTNSDDISVEQAEERNGIITAQVFFYADAIMESFGTGSLMDMSNPALKDYMSSEYWNRLRSKSNPAILTRNPGETYTDIYGVERVGGADRPGVNLEKSWNPLYQPQAPKYSIQRMEDWYFKDGTLMKKMLDDAIERFMGIIDSFFHYD